MPARAVDHEPVGTSRGVVRLACVGERRLVGPPERHRQVVDEQRRDDRLEVPAGLAAARQVDRLGAGLRRALARGITQWAWIWASSQDGPSGSAGGRSVVRDGWRPVSVWMIAAQRSPTSGRRGDRRRGSSRSSGRRRGDRRHAVVVERRCRAASSGGPDPGELLLDALDAVRRPRAPARGPARPGSPGVNVTGWAAVDGRWSLRSAATSGHRGPAARRPRPGPTCPPRSSGTSGGVVDRPTSR